MDNTNTQNIDFDTNFDQVDKKFETLMLDTNSVSEQNNNKKKK